ncbi:MAG: DUF1343 domain-containing protein [Bacteroidia bacterium]|nr:DUF1343 domain-containing protein [Bacteroidia bacterium]
MRDFAIFLLAVFLVSCGSTEKHTDHSDTYADTLLASDENTTSQTSATRGVRVMTGPEKLITENIKLLENKRVGIVGNHTSLVFGGTHLVDTLLSLGVKVKAVFAPEHGFRGTADAGEHVASGTDSKTGLPLISLYGDNRKPTEKQMQDLDVIIFDIQDIGSRHYTYIGTMTYVMQACAEHGTPLIVLDRPNPNGGYVDGPVLEKGNESFIGMHQIPIAHGMTIGEYARMVNEEGWLGNGLIADLTVITCEGYDHGMTWEETQLPWVAPSPNIGTEYAAYLYPAICWFEPTPVSVGRGTEEAFTIIGAPWYQPNATARTPENGLNYYGLEMKFYSFTPVSLPGKAKEPPFQDQLCQGLAFQNRVDGKALYLAGIQLLSDFYQQHKSAKPGETFFQKGFNRWPGSKTLQQQIEAGLTPEAIYESWQPKVSEFKKMRKKYLLYNDV